MASAPNSPVRRASVCLTCGDKGETSLLIYCRKCRDSSVHHYCMNDVSPNDDNINWCCWDCEPKDSIHEPLRKSKRICPKRQKVLKTRNLWKGRRLNQNKRLIQISNEVNEIGQSAIDRHSPTRDVESQFLNERQRDVDILEEKKSISEIPSHSKEHNESIKINELTFATESTIPIQEENNMKSFDETQKIQERGKKRRILALNDSENSNDDGKTSDLQVPSLVANDYCISSQTLCGQLSLEHDDSVSVEPVIDPKWRGWFNFKDEDDEETCVEILAHLSNKACPKVCDAATAMPYMLDTQVLEKCVVWPKSFSVALPTAASIALYFFPARERDERKYDSLLDDVIERELALKAMINNVELLIFSSYELPLQHRRFNSKYFFWGVFRQKQRSLSSATASRQKNSEMETYGHSEPTDGANNKDLLHSKSTDVLSSPNLHNLSPLSMDSSQASNVLLSKHNTQDSLSSPFKLSGLDKTSIGDSTREEGKVCCLVEAENRYKSPHFYLRPSPNTDNASAAEVV